MPTMRGSNAPLLDRAGQAHHAKGQPPSQAKEPNCPTDHYLQDKAPIATVSSGMALGRSAFLSTLLVTATSTSVALSGMVGRPNSALAFASPTSVSVSNLALGRSGSRPSPSPVAYRSLFLDLEGPTEGVTVPVAAWYPVPSGARVPAERAAGASSNGADATTPPLAVARYDHRISIRRIAQLLTGWNFIPSFFAKSYSLSSSMPNVFAAPLSGWGDGSASPLPLKAPVVILAHGYLGSRYDLSHLAEALASEGFTVLSPEYPESLSASYESGVGPPMSGNGDKPDDGTIKIDRSAISSKLLKTLREEWNVTPTAYGIVGHSLGCGTVDRTGDESWARVSLAGPPSTNFPRSGKALSVTSVGDGVMSNSGRIKGLLEGYTVTDINLLRQQKKTKFPRRAAVVLDGPTAPNHISFLAEGTNEAMIDLLSPLLPLARTLGVPVLDFDRYQESRDSRETAALVIPLIVSYLQDAMLAKEG